MIRTILVALVCIVSTFTQAELVTWSVNGHCYERRNKPGGIDWQTAQNESVADGGYLVTITSEDENAFVFGLLDHDGSWIGAFQPAGSVEPSGGWQWVTGELFAFAKWEIGEPNDGLGGPREDAIHFFDNGIDPPREAWNDVPNSLLLPAYVLESEICDEDGDGFRPPDDCDETDPNVNPNALEISFNFVDENCDGDLGDCDPCIAWSNHGQYVRCVADAVNDCSTNSFTPEEADGFVSSAVRSDIGKPGFVPPECQ